jgi:hypothetical protein
MMHVFGACRRKVDHFVALALGSRTALQSQFREVFDLFNLMNVLVSTRKRKNALLI